MSVTVNITVDIKVTVFLLSSYDKFKLNVNKHICFPSKPLLVSIQESLFSSPTLTALGNYTSIRNRWRSTGAKVGNYIQKNTG